VLLCAYSVPTLKSGTLNSILLREQTPFTLNALSF
jgi:hypothetical protein